MCKEAQISNVVIFHYAGLKDDLQSIESGNFHPLAGSYRLNLTYVYNYFLAKKVPAFTGAVPPVSNRTLLLLKTWLQTTYAQTEGMSYEAKLTTIVKKAKDSAGSVQVVESGIITVWR